MTCNVCKSEIPPGKEGYGYGKVVCSDECFQKAGETYKPNMDTNRGGGVGKQSVSI
jgi:hypothetical protein